VELNETAFANAKTIADVQRVLQEPAATPHRIRLSPLDAARTRSLAQACGLLRIGLARHTDSWPPARRRPRESPRIAGPILIVSNHITRRADIGLILAALPARFRHRLATAMGGETLQEMRNPPRDWFFARRWTYQARLLARYLALQCFSTAAAFRISRKLPLRCANPVDRGYSVLIFSRR